MSEATCTSVKFKLSNEVLGIYAFRGLPFHLLCFPGMKDGRICKAPARTGISLSNLNSASLLSKSNQLYSFYGKLGFFDGNISYESKQSSSLVRYVEVKTRRGWDSSNVAMTTRSIFTPPWMGC